MISLMNKKTLSSALAAIMLLGSTDVRGVTEVWNGTTNDMSLNTNWTPNTVPVVTDLAIIPDQTITTNSPSVLSAGNISVLGVQFIGTGSETVTVNGQGTGPASLSIASSGVQVPSGFTGNFDVIGGTAGNAATLSVVGAAGNGPGIINYSVGNGVASELNTLTLDNGQVNNAYVHVTVDGTVSPSTNTFATTSAVEVSVVNAPGANGLVSLGGVLTVGVDNDSMIIDAVVSGANGGITKTGKGRLTLSNNNTYNAGTTIQAGVISVATASTTQLGAVTSPLTFDGGILSNGTLAVYNWINPTNVTANSGTIDTNSQSITQGVTATLDGPGTLRIMNTGLSPTAALILENDNTNFATTNGTFFVEPFATLEGQGDVHSIPSVAILNNGIVQFNHNQTGTTVVFGGNMSGSGEAIIGNLLPVRPDVVQYTNTNNTYTGGTFIVGGSTLIGNGENFPQAPSDVITVSSATDTLNFAQTSTNTYAGMVAGDGVITTAGSGTNRLILTGDSSAFAGTTNIVAGDVNLNTTSTKLGGTLNMSAGVLSGIGFVGTTGKTATITGGKVKPGNSIGTLNFVGNYTQNGGQYEVELNGNGNVAGVNNDLILVAQTATLASPAQVEVVTLDGSFWIGGKYTILTAGAVVGTFDPTVLFNTTITPVLSYDNNNVYLDFRDSFLACAYNQNGRNVAEQLFTIQNPDADQLRLLNEITSLSCPDIGVALDAMSGSQYAELLIGTELATHQFVRRLYDPLRTFLAVDNTCCDCCPTNCCCNEGIEVWVEGGGTHSRFKSQGGGHGFKNKGYQVTAGAQMASDNTWVAGAAIAYEHTNTDFNFGGTANTKTVLGALYGAYRMCDFYLLGDLAFGGSQSKLKRDFFVGDILDEDNHYFERGTPEALQGILYAEFGKDFRYCSFLIQPFIGLEGGYFSFKHIKEHGDIPVDLEFDKRSYGTFDTRLGVHLSMDEIACGLFVGVDLAWQYRCTELNNYLEGGFAEFGNEFRVHGSKLDPNSFEAALNIEQKIGDNFSVFASGYWQQWKNANAYDVLAGVSYAW